MDLTDGARDVPAVDGVPDEVPTTGAPDPRPSRARRLRTRADRLAPAALTVVVTLALLAHFGMTFLANAPTNVLSTRFYTTVHAWVDPVFTQNWKLFAPAPVDDDRTQLVHAQVRTAAGELVTTPWLQVGGARDEDGLLSNVDLGRAHRLASSARRSVETAEQAVRDYFGQPAGDPAVLVADPTAPTWLVTTYSEAVDFMTRVAVEAVHEQYSGEVLQVQMEFSTTEVPRFEARDAAEDTVTPTVRDLSWWPVPEDLR